MKTAYCVAMLSAGLAWEARGQSEASTPYTVASRLAHETMWHRVEWETNQMGRVVAHTNSFVELATGLNFYDETTQQFQPSREEWEVYADGIVARSGQHKVILATNLNLAGAVDVLMPGGDKGVRLVSSPVSLGFYDPVDGKQVVIAEVKDCEPVWGAAANEIVFRDCFDRIRGSIRYLYTKAGVHQHVVLEQKLELPEGFSEKSRLECYTVFAAETPPPQITTRLLRSEANPVLRAAMVEPDFADAEISFGGAMAMRAGRAFSLGEESEGPSIRVGKQFQMIGGEPVLIEAVEFKQVEPLLARLTSVERPGTSGLAVNSSRQIKRATERARLPREHFRGMNEGREIQLASNPLKEPAVVIDYELLSSATNFTFKGDTTYFVSGSVYLSGTTHVEGGSVVKITNSTWAKVNINGAIVCQTDAYRPAVFTSQYDTSVGESIGSGTLTNYPGALVVNTAGNALHDLRISYATNGVALGFSAGQISLTSVQFVNCKHAIDLDGNSENTINVKNALFWGITNVVNGGYDNYLRGEHLTVSQCNKLFKIGSGNHNGEVYLTNSILANLAALGNADVFDGSHNGFYNSTVFGSSSFTNSSNPFQTVGAASHYLTNGSSFRDVGTTNISAALLAALKQKTTYPPIVLSNATFSASTNLVPQAARDTDTPDLGYHYAPLDWLCSQISPGIATVTITLTNGVAVGLYGYYGFSLRENNRFISEGRPEALNRIVWYPSVQEQPVKLNNASIGSSGMFDVTGATSTYTGYTKPIIRLRFTDLVGLGRRQTFFYPVAYYYGLNTASLTDCWLRGVNFTVSGYNWTVTGFPVPVATLQNSLVERSTVSLFNGYFNSAYQCPLAANLYNNLFWSSSLTLSYNDYYATAHPNWNVKDNLFGTATNNFTGTGSYMTYVNRSHNGFYSTTNNLGGTTNLTLTALSYATGALGSWYIASATPTLADQGSSPADDIGLYHYTMTTNQVKETNSIVDIGFHYVAVDTNGVPFDSNGNGIPDYHDPDSTPRTDIVWSNGVWQWKANSLAWNCWTNALACTNGAQGDFYNIATGFWLGMANQRNTNFWFRNFKGWPAYSVWNNCNTNLWPTNTQNSCSSSGYTWHGAGVLVSPEHVLATGHLGFGSNTWLAFLDMTNNVVFRQVKDYLYKSALGGETTNNLSTNMPAPPHGDYYIGLLDQPVPDNIGFVRVIPTNWWAWFDAPFYNSATNQSYHVPLLIRNCQHRTPIFLDLVTLTCSFGLRVETFDLLTLTNWNHDTFVGGDSGSPWFLTLDGELCLGRLTSSSINFGVGVEYPDPAYMQACVNAAMSELSLRNGRTNIYSLSVKDLSKYPIYRESYNCSQ